MKKNLFIFLGALALAGCSDDDKKPGGQSASELLKGEWKLVSWTNHEPYDLDGDGQASTDLYAQWNGCFKYSHLHFQPNSTVRLDYKGNESNELCHTPEQYIANPLASVPYEVKNNELVLSYEDHLASYTIRKIDNSTLQLENAALMTCCDQAIDYYTDGYLTFERVD